MDVRRPQQEGLLLPCLVWCRDSLEARHGPRLSWPHAPPKAPRAGPRGRSPDTNTRNYLIALPCPHSTQQKQTDPSPPPPDITRPLLKHTSQPIYYLDAPKALLSRKHLLGISGAKVIRVHKEERAPLTNVSTLNSDTVVREVTFEGAFNFDATSEDNLLLRYDVTRTFFSVETRFKDFKIYTKSDK